MSNAFETKNKLMKILKKKNMTIVELSKKLGLSRATIRQHMRDLESAGAIERVQNIYFKKHVSFKALKTSNEKLSKDAVLYWTSGNALFDEKKYKAAVERYTAALSLEPNYTNAYFNRAATQIKLGKLDYAEKDLMRVFELEPNSEDAAILMGEVEERRGNIQKAKQWYEKVLQFHPNCYGAKSKLYYLKNKNSNKE